MTAEDRTEPAARDLVDESRPHFREPGRGRPVRVYDWAPENTGSGAPLVVISHGTGGSGKEMGWLARPLAAAGFSVLSLDHHGNSYVDGYLPEGFLFAWERPRDISFVLDTLGLGHERVGVAGFSIGGYTAAALTGPRLDPDAVAAILAGRVPLPPIDQLPDAFEQLRETYSPYALAAVAQSSGTDVSDPRVAAAFLVSPGMGALLTRESLGGVRVPVEVRWGDADATNPFERDVRPYVELIPGAGGSAVGPGVDHADFIAAFTPDRTVARDQVAVDAVRFFEQHLRRDRLARSLVRDH
ncbi:MAG TPA: alpha/beta fold hydrolase [Nocardioides sp.]|uniref:alpha/beta hydrolase family protein n=1 Tax=Nocardioides sp. TaxID=35761 RepID=UPI002E30C234|nr:alpha/beta fold hydrolase [Nocardioides sp.]HEX5088583.1 alpha/beta fold hydrolase [Nocardioides sp.]